MPALGVLGNLVCNSLPGGVVLSLSKGAGLGATHPAADAAPLPRRGCGKTPLLGGVAVGRGGFLSREGMCAAPLLGGVAVGRGGFLRTGAC